MTLLVNLSYENVWRLNRFDGNCLDRPPIVVEIRSLSFSTRIFFKKNIELKFVHFYVVKNKPETEILKGF